MIGPAARAFSAFAWDPTVAITSAPIALSQPTARWPTPPAAAWTSTVQPACTFAQSSIRKAVVAPFNRIAAAVRSST